MIQVQFSGEKVYSNSSMAFSLFEKSRFGEKKSGRIEYGYVEVMFLVEKGKMEVFSGKKKMDYDSLIRKMKMLVLDRE